MSLPEGHPTHSHAGGKCPVTGQTHDYCAPQEGDSRSPCPALNTMANHGYIRRDGKDLTVSQVIKGLQNCYGLSWFLAWFLARVGWTILLKVGKLSLHEIGKHGKIEHDASLVHQDTPNGDSFAPITIETSLVDALCEDVEPSIVPPSAPSPPATTTSPPASSSGETSNDEKKAAAAAALPPGELKKVLCNAYDVAKSRVRREKDSPALGSAHAEIARGEMAIILGVFERQIGDKKGIPLEWLREWIGNERMPADYKPLKVQKFLDVKNRAKAIRDAMVEIRKKEADAVKDSKTSTDGLLEKKPQEEV